MFRHDTCRVVESSRKRIRIKICAIFHCAITQTVEDRAEIEEKLLSFPRENRATGERSTVSHRDVYDVPKPTRRQNKREIHDRESPVAGALSSRGSLGGNSQGPTSE